MSNRITQEDFATLPLRDILKKKFDNIEFDSHCSDLYVSCGPITRKEIQKFLKEKHVTYQIIVSTVKGQDWYGRRFIEIPFMA